MAKSIKTLHDIVLSKYDSEDDNKEISRLSDWNSEMESFSWFIHANSSTNNDECCQMDAKLLSDTFTHVHKRLLEVSIPKESMGLELDNRDSVDWLSNFAIQVWNKDDTTTTTTTGILERDPKRFEYMRAAQLLLRWYLQVYSSQQQPRNQSRTRTTDLMMTCFQTRSMLELYLRWMEKLVDLDEKRFASQLLFYSTFPVRRTGCFNNNNDDDDEISKDYRYLVEQCHMPHMILQLLWTYPPVPSSSSSSSTMRLFLSLVRNIHNALTTFPQQALKAIKETCIDVSLCVHKQNNDWFPEGQPTRISFDVIFRELVIYLLSWQQDHDTDLGNQDRQDELIVEMLRCCYAMRVNLMEDHDRWKILVHGALQPQTSYECQLTVLPLLMDVPTEAWSLQEHERVLLTILEKQIDTTMEEQWVDDRAASALMPVLAVLYKFCVADATFCRSIQLGIFPNSERMISSREGKEEVAKNMAPLDAPRGTLRWKVIQLLTWPQSFVKRLAGEFLWTLSGNEQQEFVRRVGMGNALPILGLKGLVQMPPGLNS